jgi:arylsulfatase A-like enzyme
MNIKRLLLLLLASISCLNLLSNSLSAVPARPNVVFILADDLGIGGLACYGSDWLETPNLDKLCEQGLKCTGGIAPFPVCKPSRAVTLTGQYSQRTGVYRVAERHAGYENRIRFILPENGIIHPATPLINKPFKDAGYATAMYGKWHIGAEYKPGYHPTDYGFDDAVASNGAHYNARTIPEMDIPEGITVEEVLTTRAIGFMEKAVNDEKPFFLFMPYFWVHAPFEAGPELVTYFEKKFEGRQWKGSKGGDIPVLAAMTKMLDDQCGRLFKALEDLGVEEDTIVIFTSDNGSFNENMVGEYRATKGQTYDGGMRVPYIYKWPGRIAAGAETAEPMIGTDLFPTLLTLAGLEKPEGHILDGEDLAPLLLGEVQELPQRQMYCYFPKYARYNKNKKMWGDSWRNVIYDGDYKLIEYPEYEVLEVFNRSVDPAEKYDLAKQQPEVTRTLVQKLHQHLESTGAPGYVINPEFSLED